MSEKKTFKNPRLTSYVDKVWVGWGEPYALDQGTVEFPKDEWDWEVTFTKKPEPIKVGDTVKFLTGSYQAKVLMIADNDDVWLEFADQSHTTAELSELKHAD